MKTLFIYLQKAYKYFISPLLPAACRFTPTCSEYAAEAIVRHGVIKGGFLSIYRIFRCNPWAKSGYYPVKPENRRKI